MGWFANIQNKVRHRIRPGLGVIGLVLVMASPFITYKVVKAAEAQPPTPWPADVALVSAVNGSLTQLSLLHPGLRNAIITFPVETLLSVPDAGRLRAITAFSIGQGRLVARSVEQSFGIATPYWAAWESAAVPRALDGSDNNLNSHASDAARILRGGAIDAPIELSAPGAWRDEDGIKVFAVDTKKLRKMLNDPGAAVAPTPAAPSPTASPSPKVTVVPSSVTVEVWNQGGIPGSAKATADVLRGKGYSILGFTQSRKPSVDGIVVYYVKNRAFGEAVGAELDVAAKFVTLMPRGYATEANVLVLVGKAP